MAAIKEVERALETKKRNFVVMVSAGIIAIVVCILVSLCIGVTELDIKNVLKVLFPVFGEENNEIKTIILGIRLPRAIVSMLTGASLSLAGCMVQILVRNPLADPYIMGIASGAAFGAFFIFIMAPSGALFLLPLFAFLGSMLAFILSLTLAKFAGETPLSVILAGVAIGSGFSSLVTILLFIFQEKTHGLFLWLFGTFTMSRWSEVWPILAVASFGIFYSLVRAKQLNILMLGENYALQLGVNVKKLRRELLAISCLLTGVSVSFSGIIGFVGLISPHISRLLVGADHRLVIPASLIIGSLMTTLADLIARIAIAPAELPVGALISLVGVPFFIYLLVKSRRYYVM